ncbi:hypothetical protein RJT34_15959 [Clitoria ternatea]|uniref:Uncharacterized protein n=1 Tax=Clitoria ternatea TaxID=43366 RepID=A0AAN9J8C6_CLITE
MPQQRIPPSLPSTIPLFTKSLSLTPLPSASSLSPWNLNSPSNPPNVPPSSASPPFFLLLDLHSFLCAAGNASAAMPRRLDVGRPFEDSLKLEDKLSESHNYSARLIQQVTRSWLHQRHQQGLDISPDIMISDMGAASTTV